MGKGSLRLTPQNQDPAQQGLRILWLHFENVALSLLVLAVVASVPQSGSGRTAAKRKRTLSKKSRYILASFWNYYLLGASQQTPAQV
jgi:hypothetical protein